MEQNHRIMSVNAVGIITEALREIVPDVGVRVRRTFAFDEHDMSPVEFVHSLSSSFSHSFNGFNTRGVGYLLVPMASVFAPMSPGEACTAHVLLRRLAFMETCVKYTHQFYRETLARELETAPQRDLDDGAKALTRRISELCLQLLDEESMREALTLFWDESQHPAIANSRTIHALTAEQVVWTAGSDRFTLSERGLAWEKNGQRWFGSAHIEGVEHTLRFVPQTQLGAQLADAARGNKTSPVLTVVG